MGVFLQPDPIGFKGDAANIYRFCNNNAVNRSDPMGLIDSNNFDPSTIDYKWAERANLSMYPNAFTYGAHGGEHDDNYGQALNPAFRSRGVTLPLQTVVASITGKQIFQHKSETLLLVCNSGADRSNFARSVARATGKDVLAPNKYLWLLDQPKHPFVVAGGYRDRSGHLIMDKNDPGHLTRFRPDGSSKPGKDFDIGAKDVKGAIPVGGPGLDGRSSSPSAADVDAANPAQGVPSLGVETGNFVRSSRL
jgi:hypothetical protein